MAPKGKVVVANFGAEVLEEREEKRTGTVEA